MHKTYTTYILQKKHVWYMFMVCKCVHITPLQVAINEARLGTMEELVECVRCADILKPSKLAAEGLLEVLSNSGRSTR